MSLKGQCHEIFCFWFFSWISFPPPKVFHLDRFEFFRKFAEIFASQGAPPISMTPVANLPPLSTTPATKLPPVSTTPVANLPPVSATPVANCQRYQRHRRQICHRCRWHWWRIMATISGCRHLKVNLKVKIYIYVNSTTQRCSNKIIKIFLLEGFFHLRISPRIFEKFKTALIL